MKHLNYILPAALLLIATTSCKKLTDTTPASKLNNKTSVTQTSVPSAPIDTDLLIHSISFSAPTQYVITSVAGNEITMVYNENVNLFIPKQGYDLSWAIHLTEDFSSAILSKFDYATVDDQGHINTDWVDDNLNGVNSKTVTDTTIKNMAMVKINVQRQFTFTKEYADNATAVPAQNTILLITTNKIAFSSYVSFTENYPATSASLPVTYIKGN